MEAPKCRLCEKRHYGSCAQAVVPTEPRVKRSSKKQARKKQARKKPEKGYDGHPGFGEKKSGGLVMEQSQGSTEGCDLCGSTAAIFADAAKWRRLRARRREYMAARRKKVDEGHD